MKELENRYETTITSWNKVAQAYQDKFMDVDLYNDSYDAFCELITKDARILELGCGPGNITKYLYAKRPDLKIDAIDAAPDMIGLARQNVPSASFSVMDIRGIFSIKEKFQGIMCGFCMPYLSREDVTKLIIDSHDLLENDGILYLSCIESDHSLSGYERASSGNSMFVYYYEEMYLAELLKKNNFEPIKLMRKEMRGTSHVSAVHLIMIARKIS